ncbi:MAG: hypothetical protein ABL959_16730 [Pyrinomonadaceae bacterium]
MAGDFYPHGMELRASWHANYAANVPGLATKYNITAPQLEAIERDNNWMQFWVAERAAAATFAAQLSVYFNSISGNDNSLDPPATPAYTLAGAPPEVPPGIEFRVREIARQIKGHSAYAEADGTLLGIIGDSGGVQGIGGVPVPEIQTFAANSGYEFAIVISKRGSSDSSQVWASIAGENKYNLLATITGKSGNVVYVPLDQDNPQPVQLWVRVQLRRNNQDYGDTSLISPVTVNP